jgi:hypothetical protein
LYNSEIEPESRKSFKVCNGINNLFNLAYELLAWIVHKALVNAKLANQTSLSPTPLTTQEPFLTSIVAVVSRVVAVVLAVAGLLVI